MLFNSLHFIVFFPIVVLGYFSIPQPFRWIWLLSASIYFYMAFIPSYVIFLFILILIDYLAALLIERFEGERRRWCLGLSLAANLIFLSLFKYLHFFNHIFSTLLTPWGFRGILLRWPFVLPLGLSFHTFQAMSYTFDVYYRRQQPERHLGRYALYVMLFPQLVAGPIERAWHLLPQIQAPHEFHYANAVGGLRLMLLGFIKKMVIADRLSMYVDPVFRSPHVYVGWPLWVATYCFCFQIYCDFSGYTDIARGCARVLGFQLVNNFTSPYFSSSPIEFWKRWHISLSSWFRDYVYIPLGGSRVNVSRMVFNLMVVFVLSGLWHGANMTYIIWGAYHGVLVSGLHLLKRSTEWALSLERKIDGCRWLRRAMMFMTFNAICLGWILFRAEHASQAIFIIRHLFAWQNHVSLRTLWSAPFLITVGLVVCLVISEAIDHQYPLGEILMKSNLYVRWAIYYVGVSLLFFLSPGMGKTFIYFQF